MKTIYHCQVLFLKERGYTERIIMSAPYEKWLALGERLGYTGEKLETFVAKKEQEFLDREERVRKREDEREAREAEIEAKDGNKRPNARNARYSLKSNAGKKNMPWSLSVCRWRLRFVQATPNFTLNSRNVNFCFVRKNWN